MSGFDATCDILVHECKPCACRYLLALKDAGGYRLT
nr:MAG TPA: hypothetical protein [Herelleviridae sp.]